MIRVLHLNVRESKLVLDSRFHAMDSGFHALNSTLWWWNLDSGLQSLVRFQIPKPTIPDSTSKTSRIAESSSKTSRIPDSTSKTSQIPDSTSKASRSAESGFPYMGRSVPGVTLKDLGQRNLWNLPTPRNKAWCSLQAPELGYRPLCGVFNRESWSVTSFFFSDVFVLLSWRFHRLVYFQNAN